MNLDLSKYGYQVNKQSKRRIKELIGFHSLFTWAYVGVIAIEPLHMSLEISWRYQ